MSGEVRPVEEIRADLAATHGPVTLDQWYPARLRLAADVEPLLTRLAAADRENAELRRDVASLTEQIAATDARVVELVGQVAEAREAHDIDLAEEVTALEAAEARLEAVRARAVAIMQAWNPGDPAYKAARELHALALSAAPQPEPDEWCARCPMGNVVNDGAHRAWHARWDAFAERERRQSPEPDSRRWGGSMRPMPDPYRSATPEPPASDEPARCAHGETDAHELWDDAWPMERKLAADAGCPGPAASGTPDEPPIPMHADCPHSETIPMLGSTDWIVCTACGTQISYWPDGGQR